MKSILILFSAMAAVLTVVGCSTPSHDVNLSRGTFTQEDAARQAFEYREQARYYSFLAQKLDEEARMMSTKSGNSDKGVLAKLALSQEYQRASAEAAGKATEIQRQVPHGMMQ